MKPIKDYLKPIYHKIFPNYVYYLKKELSDCESVLDLGCGRNSSMQYCDVPFSVGVELFDMYLKETKDKGIHNKYIKEDVTKVNFEPKTFDAVMMIDVIEHLQKEDALELIKKMETWAKKKIIILTPNGFVHQHYIDDNHLQEHKSGWLTDEFERVGFKVSGMNGLRWLRGEGAFLKYNPFYFWLLISEITQKLTYYNPKLAFHLFAVKKIK